MDSEPNDNNAEEKKNPEQAYREWFKEFIRQNGIPLDARYTVIAIVDFTSTPFRDTSNSVLRLLQGTEAEDNPINQDSQQRSPPDLERLKVYCDASDCIMYLSITLNLTAQDLSPLAGVKDNSMVEKDILSLLEHQNFRTLLFTFLTSDVVVILNDSRLLTTAITSTLRLLSALKRKIFPLLGHLEEKLFGTDADSSQVEIGQGFSYFIRKVPVLSFVFHGIPSTITTPQFQQNLESRIQLLFRACGMENYDRLYKHDGRQLFFLPPSSLSYSFVHFSSWKVESNPVTDLLSHYFCGFETEKPSWEEAGQDHPNIHFGHVNALRNQLLEWAKKSYELKNKNQRNFAENTVLEIDSWINASAFLFAKIFIPVFNADRKKSVEEVVYRRLKEYIELDRQVSLSHCKQAMNKSIDWYIAGCPPHYTEQLHEHKVKSKRNNSSGTVASKEDNVNRKDQEKHSKKPLFDDKPRSSRKSKRGRGSGKYGREGRLKPNGYLGIEYDNTTNGSPINAQLQRIIIVTPGAPISCVLSPSVKIELDEHTVTIPLCDKEGFVLPKESVVVLRLPYIYYDGQTPISPPTEELKAKFNLAKHFLSTHINEAS
ncbi:hypothetical protein K493DRAFT_359767 [Basidiobolus meristosporus CBS 931.73]|uniref:Nonsense-mediated mRNA decay factor SMG8 n=1 Tax=Basidiobolus meristosporus CBS 931.73 TaxID=1314790 RepID=A0A1Y1XQ05_9FUNG|nr:hypothetical protein K493DRAFT_359767 [Basidiobolus meristosporus CBS 931.73]|eukprot:ORX87827.1 hypothetical protein K493DRAFT_359767 [Basidiobolus meristosporus CBS 931.73]